MNARQKRANKRRKNIKLKQYCKLALSLVLLAVMLWFLADAVFDDAEETVCKNLSTEQLKEQYNCKEILN